MCTSLDNFIFDCRRELSIFCPKAWHCKHFVTGKYRNDAQPIADIALAYAKQGKADETREHMTGRIDGGAVGLLQILPITARDPGFGVAGLEGSDEEIVAQFKDPYVNRRLGSEYLSAMLHRYHGDADLALVAYNAGPARADTAAKDERPLDKFVELNPKAAQETLPYIKRVLGDV